MSATIGVKPGDLDGKITKLQDLREKIPAGVSKSVLSFGRKSQGPCERSLKSFDEEVYTNHAKLLGDVLDATIAYLERAKAELKPR
ncbi:MAG: hypothetical protein FWG40_06490 [Peptococcaceae bacterium]|nr:hypothetical protein [Peptococcaceae bacterium]